MDAAATAMAGESKRRVENCIPKRDGTPYYTYDGAAGGSLTCMYPTSGTYTRRVQRRRYNDAKWQPLRPAHSIHQGGRAICMRTGWAPGRAVSLQNNRRLSLGFLTPGPPGCDRERALHFGAPINGFLV